MRPCPAILFVTTFFAAVGDNCRALVPFLHVRHPTKIRSDIPRISLSHSAAPSIASIEQQNGINSLTTTTTTSSSSSSSGINVDTDDDRLVKELGRSFAQKFVELQLYRQENGHCLVPKRYETNPALGNWVNKQRQNYRKFINGESSSMNEVSGIFLHVAVFR